MRSSENTRAPSSASTAVWYPEPVPTSSTRSSPSASSSASLMRATMYGCEIVWRAPIGSGVSSYACGCSPGSTNRWRGTRRIASRTRPSAIPRAASCAATMRLRSSSNASPISRPREVERLQGVERLVVREVEVDRRHRDESLAHGVEVGPFLLDELELLASDPVVLLAPRIDLLDDRIAVSAPSHAGQGEATDRLSVLRSGHVHVEERVGRKSALEHPGREPRGERGGGLEPEAAAADRRDRQGGDAEQRPLHRGGDRAGVRHVVAQVRSLVDPREDK